MGIPIKIIHFIPKDLNCCNTKNKPRIPVDHVKKSIKVLDYLYTSVGKSDKECYNDTNNQY